MRQSLVRQPAGTDLGVDPNKSTWVNFGIRSPVRLILLDAVDPMSNLKQLTFVWFWFLRLVTILEHTTNVLTYIFT